jgi:hypothetical protein
MKTVFLQAFAFGRYEKTECNDPNQAKKLKEDSEPEK